MPEAQMNKIMRPLKRDLPRQSVKRCACGDVAVKFCGTEGICERCARLQDGRAADMRRVPRGLTAAKWNEPEPEDGGARFWKQKLEFWLPNPKPGWGSLELLERRLGA
jgi:hypothetical protein